MVPRAANRQSSPRSFGDYVKEITMEWKSKVVFSRPFFAKHDLP